MTQKLESQAAMAK